MQKDLLNRLKDMPKGQLITIIVVVVGFFVLLDLNGRLSTLYTLRQDVDTDSTKVVALYATEVYLRTELAKMNNVQKLEEFGRESGYIQPGDIPIAPIAVEDPEASMNESKEDDNQKPPHLQNWELWWFLLFENE